ncbi:hypothetical protein ACIA8C_23980 [Nocardia sp. NPDC051321]|uniref:hypothetical protein n=1 Tax=Nocardia sp. NPDC051321 TaxID=3364323 RepID=UPI0037AD24D0
MFGKKTAESCSDSIRIGLADWTNNRGLDRRGRIRGEGGDVVHRGQRFGVDLYELEKVAKADFPTISGDYSAAIGGCDRVRGEIAQVMRRPEQFGGDSLGPVYRAYLDLHDTIAGFLKETRVNLDDTAVALDKAARYFAGTDREAAAEMNRRVHDDPETGSRP